MFKSIKYLMLGLSLIASSAIASTSTATFSFTTKLEEASTQLTEWRGRTAIRTAHEVINTMSHVDLDENITKSFVRASIKYGVDLNILVGVCRTESGLTPSAMNKNATGMCQIIPYWHNTTKKDMLNPHRNIDMAANILADNFKVCKGNRDCAIQSYNVGQGAYKKGVRNKVYLNKVLGYSHEYVKLADNLNADRKLAVN